MKKYVKVTISVMTSEKNNILEFNQYMISDKMSYIIHANIQKIDRCANDPKKTSTRKLGEHIPCGYLIPTT